MTQAGSKAPFVPTALSTLACLSFIVYSECNLHQLKKKWIIQRNGAKAK